MPKNLIARNYNKVLIGQRYEDGYINLTSMAKANGKLIGDYLRLESTNAFLAELSGSMGIPIDQLVSRKVTGPNSDRGTWGHPQVAINCGQWCSPAFAVKVTEWVMSWVKSGQNPLQSDLDRLVYRDTLRDDARVRMCDQIKSYLEKIRRYDDRKYSGIYFARVHDAINVAVTGEKAKAIRERLGGYLGRKVKDYELIRDYFPAIYLQRYIAMCEATANFMLQGLKPLDAVEKARQIVLPHNYFPKAIDFSESIKFVHERITRLPAA